MSHSILIVDRDEILKTAENLPFEEITVHHFMVGAYNQAMKSKLVILRDNKICRVLKNTESFIPEMFPTKDLARYIKEATR